MNDPDLARISGACASEGFAVARSKGAQARLQLAA